MALDGYIRVSAGTQGEKANSLETHKRRIDSIAKRYSVSRQRVSQIIGKQHPKWT